MIILKLIFTIMKAIRKLFLLLIFVSNYSLGEVTITSENDLKEYLTDVITNPGNEPPSYLCTGTGSIDCPYSKEKVKIIIAY